MTIARLYEMTAVAGKEDELLASLTALAGLVRQIAECEGVVLMQDTERPTRFLFIESWRSIEAHKAASTQLPKEALKPVMAALAEPPAGRYLDRLLAL